MAGQREREREGERIEHKKECGFKESVISNV